MNKAKITDVLKSWLGAQIPDQNVCLQKFSEPSTPPVNQYFLLSEETDVLRSSYPIYLLNLLVNKLWTLLIKLI